MPRNQENELLHRRVAAALPQVRFMVSDELAEFAASMVCELHRMGESCDGDCEDVAREILALMFLYNARAGEGDDCLACMLSASDVCLFHEGQDQAILDEVGRNFVEPSRWRHRETRRLLPGAIGTWFTKFRLAWWLDKVFSLGLLVIGATLMLTPVAYHWSLRWLLIGFGTGLGAWCAAVANVAMVVLSQTDLERGT